MSLDFGDAEQSRYCDSQGVEIVGYDVLYDGVVDVEVFMNEEISHGTDLALGDLGPLSGDGLR